ncbi:MAG: threonylcarbamoyl-AMP synthase [Clostridiales bacterium]|jgi:L-threonylcarbamoyladenylate synthase|nr:threonylcarbamoyl-AMP synthase [Clostridiales bacterium]
MRTIIKRVSEESLLCAAEILRAGGLVAFPTETVYGLGANFLLERACAGIFAAKGRPADNPLILHISSADELPRVAEKIPRAAFDLAEAFWPGPLTLVLKKSSLVPDIVTAGRDTVAVRLPANAAARNLIDLTGAPVAAPSANRSTTVSPTCAEHVREDLDGLIDMILDGGACLAGLESTIIDLSGDSFEILRPGVITPEDLARVLGAKPRLHAPGKDEPPRAPGMKYKHYAPKAEIVVFFGQAHKTAERVNGIIAASADPSRIGVLATNETAEMYDGRALVLSVGSRGDVLEICRNLFRVLRLFDERGAGVIYAEALPERAAGRAAMNRLMKAASEVVRL